MMKKGHKEKGEEEEIRQKRVKWREEERLRRRGGVTHSAPLTSEENGNERNTQWPHYIQTQRGARLGLKPGVER